MLEKNRVCKKNEDFVKDILILIQSQSFNSVLILIQSQSFNSILILI